MMWIKSAGVLMCFVCCVFAHCENSIKVQGVSNTYGNQKVNGEYAKLYDHDDGTGSCDGRDVFNHTTQDIYLFHIDDLLGYWIFMDEYVCSGANEGAAYVRSKDGELNPGLVQLGWEENTNTGSGFTNDNDIDVDCFEIPRCRYQMTGAFDTKFNGYYDEVDNAKCEFRDVHKHETQDAYLYFKWSNKGGDEYYWVVGPAMCDDSVGDTAYMYNDDYSTSPELILDDWMEYNSTLDDYILNPNLDIDCFAGATRPGMYISVVLAFVAVWSVL